jgi:hypothetical protein
MAATTRLSPLFMAGPASREVTRRRLVRMEAKPDAVESRLRDAGLIVSTSRGGVEHHQLTPKALSLLWPRDHLEGRDACEVVLEGGWYTELLIVMSRATAADGLSWGDGGRKSLVESVADFADRGGQRQMWIELDVPPDYDYDWSEAVLDFAMFGEEPGSLVGQVLHSDKEAEAVAELWARIDTADRVARTRGMGDYEDFVRLYQLPEWDDVVIAARQTLDVLAEHATGEPKRA